MVRYVSCRFQQGAVHAERTLTWHMRSGLQGRGQNPGEQGTLSRALPHCLRPSSLPGVLWRPQHVRADHCLLQAWISECGWRSVRPPLLLLHWVLGLGL